MSPVAISEMFLQRLHISRFVVFRQISSDLPIFLQNLLIFLKRFWVKLGHFSIRKVSKSILILIGEEKTMNNCCAHQYKSVDDIQYYSYRGFQRTCIQLIKNYIYTVNVDIFAQLGLLLEISYNLAHTIYLEIKF